MKYFKIIFVLIWIIQIETKAQHHIIYDIFYLKSDTLELDINEYESTYKLVQKPMVGFDWIRSYEPISTGLLRKRSNIYYCYDKRLKRVYVFKIIDQYTLESVKHTINFKKGMHIYATTMLNSYRAIRFMNWANGNRNGKWIYVYDNGYAIVQYSNGLKIDSVFHVRDR